MLSFFRPGIGELDDDALQQSFGQGLQPGNDIIVNNADVVRPGFQQLQQQGPDAGGVYLGTDAAPVRPLPGDGGQVLAVTEAYFSRSGFWPFQGSSQTAWASIRQAGKCSATARV